jgi:cation transport regulator ChaC
MLHFAYGSNMYRALMRKHAPAATPIGVARLADYRFVITADGYASIEPARARTVHGMLWRLTPRDRVTLDAWENIAGGLYRAETVPVRCDGRQRPALVYIARPRPRPRGKPKPGYMEIVVKAARELELPADYIASLQEWLPTRPLGAGHRKLGEFV